MRIVSPRKSCSFSMVAGFSATTELSSLTASSTTSRLGDFFLSKIAVEKSFFAPFLKTKKKEGRISNHKYKSQNFLETIFRVNKKLSRLTDREVMNEREKTYESDDSPWLVIFGDLDQGSSGDKLDFCWRREQRVQEKDIEEEK